MRAFDAAGNRSDASRHVPRPVAPGRRYPRGMPLSAWALVTLFSLCSIALGVLAVPDRRRAGGPSGVAAFVVPILAAFCAFYLIGHGSGWRSGRR